MGYLSTIDIIGFWIGIFLTFCILSFLYNDNPLYKFAEHLFIGVSVGYVITRQYYDVIHPKLIGNLIAGEWIYLIVLALSIMFLLRAVSQRWSWVGRYPIAIVVAFYAGLQINGVAQGDLGPQMSKAMDSLDVAKVNINEASIKTLGELPGVSPSIANAIAQQRTIKPFANFDEVLNLKALTLVQKESLESHRYGIAGLEAQASMDDEGRYWVGILSQVLLLVGLLSSLVYFYFSVEHKGVIGKISSVGVWTVMIGFGAAFGFTVQGRISLAIGRALDVLGQDKDPMIAAQIHGETAALVSIALVVLFLIVWERKTSHKNG